MVVIVRHPAQTKNSQLCSHNEHGSAYNGPFWFGNKFDNFHISGIFDSWTVQGVEEVGNIWLAGLVRPVPGTEAPHLHPALPLLPHHPGIHPTYQSSHVTLLSVQPSTISLLSPNFISSQHFNTFSTINHHHIHLLISPLIPSPELMSRLEADPGLPQQVSPSTCRGLVTGVGLVWG